DSPPHLTLSEADMLKVGEHTLKHIVERLSQPGAGPVHRHLTRGELDIEWEEPPPEHGEDPVLLVDRLVNGALTAGMRSDHPRCFAFVPSAGNYPAVLADALAAAFLAVPGAWLVGSGATRIEMVTVQWLCQLLGLPSGSGGLFVSGGTEANLLALTVARDSRLDGRLQDARAYCSDQAHPSVAKALHVLGFRREQLVVVPADTALRLPVDPLAQRIRRDRAAGLRPFAVIATAGTTGTGAVDPLPELAAVCRAEDLWLHTDGAMGAAARIAPHGRELLPGLEFSDSVTVDPHKWFFQPYDTGCVLLRDPDLLRRSFAMARYGLDVEAGYLDASRCESPTSPASGEVNLSDYGIQLSRSLRALRLWLSFKTFGVGAFREAVAHGMRLAEHAGRRIDEAPDLEPVTPPGLGVLTFRCRPHNGPTPGPRLDLLQTRVSEEVVAKGEAMILTTRLRGERVLRLCTINPRADEADIDATLELVRAVARHHTTSPTPV
ncbi:pyridoxal phosphate-dependent decarboxylase family protein, partial [Streptomyces alkaliphilus]|uniref:pyridoxal phosphate-dependent decarboxylase family protein n=1 Tax=Streptomyces alkaliphilus TaxID=1472722 RepID=UPI001E2B1673